jgi:hypothetical protein
MKTGPNSYLITAALLLALVFGVLAPPAAVQSQGQVSFASVRVEIWPEYDQPSVLVIYNITLSPQVSLPATVGLRIPASAGRPHAVAMQDPAGLYNLNYEPFAAGEWIEVRFTTPVPDVHIEYYDPDLRKSGERRDFVYRWPGDFAVENLSLRVQQPGNATQMGFRPSMGSGSIAEDGLVYYSYLAGSVSSGTQVDLEIWYEKPDDTLTSPEQFQPVQPAAPVDAGTAGRVTLDQVLPWAIGGLGVLLIVAGLAYYWQTGRASAQTAKRAGRHHRRSRREPPPTAVGAAEEGVFCHQCGKRAAVSDVFCRTCGKKLRQ